MTVRQYAALMWQVGFNYREIAAQCSVAESTCRTWKRKDKWGNRTKATNDNARAAVLAAAPAVDFTHKDVFPQPAQEPNTIHGLRSRLFDNFSKNAKALIADVLNSPTDELSDLQAASAISQSLISTWAAQIQELEAQAQQAANKAGLESEGIITGITISNEISAGERAGKPENLKTTRTERQIIRYTDAIERLRQAIARENVNFSKIQERIHTVRIQREKWEHERPSDGGTVSKLAELFKIAPDTD